MREIKAINVVVGKQIKVARESIGMTQERFGELVELGTKNVSAVERGVAGVSLEKLKRICDVLAVSSDTLLFESSDHKNEVQVICERLERLTPEQFDIARRILNV